MSVVRETLRHSLIIPTSTIKTSPGIDIPIKHVCAPGSSQQHSFQIILFVSSSARRMSSKRVWDETQSPYNSTVSSVEKDMPPFAESVTNKSQPIKFGKQKQSWGRNRGETDRPRSPEFVCLLDARNRFGRRIHPEYRLGTYNPPNRLYSVNRNGIKLCHLMEKNWMWWTTRLIGALLSFRSCAFCVGACDGLTWLLLILAHTGAGRDGHVGEWEVEIFLGEKAISVSQPHCSPPSEIGLFEIPKLSSESSDSHRHCWLQKIKTLVSRYGFSLRNSSNLHRR